MNISITRERPSKRRRALVVSLAIGLVLLTAIGIWVYRGSEARALNRATRLAVRTGHYAQAEAPLKAWLRADPRSVEAHLLKARVELGLNRPDEAVEPLKAALAIGPPSSQAETVRGLVLAAAGRYAEAEPILLRARAETPEIDPQVEQGLARICLETYRLAPAGLALDRWISILPRDPKPYLWKAEIHQRTENGLLELANDYREALKRDPSLDAARLGLIRALGQQGQFNEAANELETHFARRPDDPEAHLLAGRNAFKRGEIDAASRHFDRSIALKPDNTQPLIERAGIDLHAGHPLASLAFLDRAAKIDPFDPEIRYRRSQTLTILGRLDEAKQDQEASVRLKRDGDRMAEIRAGLIQHPGDLKYQREAAQWMIAHGHAEEALRWARHILKTTASDPAMNLLLANYHQSQGETGLANYYRNAAARFVQTVK